MNGDFSKVLRGVLMVPLLALSSLGAEAALLFSVDLDPATPGTFDGTVDTTRAVQAGEKFRVDIVLTNTAALVSSVFDSVQFSVFPLDPSTIFPDGASAVMGQFATSFPPVTSVGNGPGVVAAGGAVTPVSLMPPAFAFTLPAAVSLGPNTALTLLSIEFEALAIGASNVMVVGGLMSGTNAISSETPPALPQVTVTPATVGAQPAPEPSTLLLLGLGLVAAGFARGGFRRTR